MTLTLQLTPDQVTLLEHFNREHFRSAATLETVAALLLNNAFLNPGRTTSQINSLVRYLGREGFSTQDFAPAVQRMLEDRARSD